ncbi:nucleoside recognition protein [candidate division TA06 bacterium]|uniref:Nucleoside recognition protein n=1 Tax=candidate division TA06 bacterium TaxID=2250710 RepID=A0A933MKD4_UNCT6|nr:nucleoside recognition protein [candidate division TA06 bacterium]
MNKIDFKNTLLSGLKKGLDSFWQLMKMVAPVYTAICILRATPAMDWFASFCAPAMKCFGLPGESALALIVGNLVNLYASIGVIAGLKLQPQQLTLLSLMLLISHSQILESAVFAQIKTRYLLLSLFRFLLSLFLGWSLHFFILG